MPFFSVIISYYQPSQSDYVAQRLLDSLKNQNFKDFEVIFVHDGPLTRKFNLNMEGLNFKLYNSSIRMNKWGHNCRDIGIMKSEGEYLIISNADNIYYDCFKELKDIIVKDKKELYTTRVKMMGMKPNFVYDKPRDYNKFIVLDGHVEFCRIDLMQLILKGDVLRKVGWWDMREQSDGVVAVTLDKKFGHVKTGIMIGEHY
jgi:glycosyltransferase involved in cell wall biosynthesis